MGLWHCFVPLIHLKGWWVSPEILNGALELTNSGWVQYCIERSNENKQWVTFTNVKTKQTENI